MTARRSLISSEPHPTTQPAQVLADRVAAADPFQEAQSIARGLLGLEAVLVAKTPCTTTGGLFCVACAGRGSQLTELYVLRNCITLLL